MTYRCRKTLRLIAVALMLSLGGGRALASCTEHWLVTTVPLYAMAKSNWCWAAVSLMILKDFHPDYPGSQSSLVRHVTGTTANVTGSPDLILNDPDLSDVGHDWADGWDPIPFDTIIQNLQWNLPLQLDLENGKGGKHAVVVFGYHEIDCQYNGVVNLLIWDPAGHYYEISYDDLLGAGWVGTRYNFRLN
jgi:hypothetical protein